MDGTLTGTTTPPGKHGLLKARTMKEYSKLSKSLKLELHYQMQFHVIPRILLFFWKKESYLSAQDTVHIF